jgi:hypothetical protein
MLKSKAPPYQNTHVDPAKTKYQIEKLLSDYGAEAVQWTQSYATQEMQLRFIFEVEVKGVRRKIGFLVRPPMFAIRRRRRGYGLVNEPQYSQSLRLLYWYVKAKLEAAAYGLDSLERVFMSEVVFKLPDGREATVGDTVVKMIEQGKESLLALPAEQEDPKVIEAGND